MDKSILLPVHPRFARMILTGEKTLEIRKRYPQQAGVPFRVLIYCTLPVEDWSLNGAHGCWDILYRKGKRLKLYEELYRNPEFRQSETGAWENLCGRVIGEFECRIVYRIAPWETEFVLGAEEKERELLDLCEKAKIPRRELERYSGADVFYAWEVSEPVLWENAKNLREYGVERPPRSFEYLKI